MAPAVLKGAVTNCIRFLGYGVITRAIRNGDEDLTPAQTMLAGGVAGAVSAVLSQASVPLASPHILEPTRSSHRRPDL